MLDLIYSIGVERFLKIAAATVALPQKPKLFGTMTPAQNLTPARYAKNKIKPVPGGNLDTSSSTKPIQPPSASKAQASKG